MISVVVPALDKALGIADCLASARDPDVVEIIVVDGGSRDATREIASRLASVVTSPAGRAAQMNAGAARATGEVLLFLHADTRLPPGFGKAVRRAVEGGAVGGRFDLRVEGSHPCLGLLSAAINARSRWSGISTGDQALFATREAFRAVGGFESIPLMEDVRFTAALRRLGPVAALRERVSTSGRRWERHGFARTVLLMWRLRLLHAWGVSPERLAARYRAVR
ncbi:MAG: TIGR04283 family arsenosugar biosynthesis glycosyltransferase [Alphaproteobacteria bacterium]